MKEKHCTFKKNGCPFPASSSEVCLKSDESKCTMADILKEKAFLMAENNFRYKKAAG